MNVKTKFNLEQVVNILPLDLLGTIEEINIDRKGVRYYTKYYCYMEAKYGYFSESELEKKEVTKTCGYLANLEESKEDE